MNELFKLGKITDETMGQTQGTFCENLDNTQGTSTPKGFGTQNSHGDCHFLIGEAKMNELFKLGKITDETMGGLGTFCENLDSTQGTSTPRGFGTQNSHGDCHS